MSFFIISYCSIGTKEFLTQKTIPLFFTIDLTTAHVNELNAGDVFIPLLEEYYE
jgi:hypothetical protein